MERFDPRPTWDEYFLELAELAATRSSCDRAKVGAVITVDNSCIATGYNGGVAGMDNCCDVGHYLEEGHCIRTVHAEMNAILQSARQGHSTMGGTIYVTHYPCINCMKAIAQAGIKRIVYAKDYRNHKLSKMITDSLDIEVVKLKEDQL